MDDHFDISRVFEIGKFDITRLTCILFVTEVLEQPVSETYEYKDMAIRE